MSTESVTDADRLIADLNAALGKYPNLRLYVGGYECDFEIEDTEGRTVARLWEHGGIIERLDR